MVPIHCPFVFILKKMRNNNLKVFSIVINIMLQMLSIELILYSTQFFFFKQHLSVMHKTTGDIY